MNFTSQRDGVGMNTNTRNYQPINSYGVIGDCHSVVLVAPDGSVDWGCLPDFDSPAIFCRLLDAERGGVLSDCPYRWCDSGNAALLARQQCTANSLCQY